MTLELGSQSCAHDVKAVGNCVYTVYNERTRTEVRDETTDGGTGEVTTVLGSDEDIEGSL